MTDINKIIQAISAGNNSVPAFSLLRDLNKASVLSKTISDPNRSPQYDEKGNRKVREPDLTELRNLSIDKARDITDADIVMQMLPDLELSSQILISSILSPKDMMSTELSYIPPENVCPPNVAGSITRLIKDHFSVNYKIESKLHRILKDILYETGSYVLCVIPENSIDEIINNQSRLSQESIDNIFGEYDQKLSLLPPKGLLGDSNTHYKNTFSIENYRKRNTTKGKTKVEVSVEDFNNKYKDFNINNDNYKKYKVSNENELDTFVSVTDNFEVLSVPRLIDKLRSNTVESIISNESNYITDRDIDQLLYRRMYYSSNNIVKVKTLDQGYRTSVGEPLIMHLPSESVIPVYVPGNPREHIGYFVLIDENGNPVSKDANPDYFREMGILTQNNRKCLSSHLLDRSKGLFEGYGNASTVQKLRYDHASRVYGEIIEQDLISRLRNGIYGKNVKIGGSEEIYRIMFSRSLSQQYTQILFLPKELMTYMAFRFDENGIGESLLDRMKIVNSMAITLQLANTRAAVMNSIPRTKVSVKLDEDEPDPEGRREMIVNEYLLLRSVGNNSMPIGVLNPVDINTWATQANVEFQFSGALSMPEIEIDQTEFSSQVPKVDTELEEDMRKRRIMGQGMSPETIDASQGANFATSIIQESLLFARRAMQYQELFVPLITDHIRKVTMASPILLDSIKEIIHNNLEDIVKYLLPDRKNINLDEVNIDIITKAFVSQLEVELPKPDGLSLTRKKEAYEEYKGALEEAISQYISSELLPSEIMGELGDNADAVKQILIAYYCRKWMVENDYLSELNDLVTLDEEDNPVFDVYEMTADFGSSIIKSIGKMLDKARPMKETADLYVKENEVEESDSFTSDTGSDSDFDTTDTGDDFGMDGLDDFDMGNDIEETEEDIDGPTDDQL